MLSRTLAVALAAGMVSVLSACGVEGYPEYDTQTKLGKVVTPTPRPTVNPTVVALEASQDPLPGANQLEMEDFLRANGFRPDSTGWYLVGSKANRHARTGEWFQVIVKPVSHRFEKSPVRRVEIYWHPSSVLRDDITLVFGAILDTAVGKRCADSVVQAFLRVLDKPFRALLDGSGWEKYGSYLLCESKVVAKIAYVSAPGAQSYVVIMGRIR